MRNAFYSSSIGDFLEEDINSILGKLAHENYFSLETTQRNTWITEIRMLKATLPKTYSEGRIIFEYTIPRLGKRIDVVLLIGGVVFILEYKDHATEYLKADKDQAMGYAIDLNCFHKESRNKILVPILISTAAGTSSNNSYTFSEPLIYNVFESNGTDLLDIIKTVLSRNSLNSLDPEWALKWENSRYQPTPTIIEAATSLYENHDVSAIANCESDANLKITSDKIISIIHNLKERNNGSKAVCFVTGVPGAGKTLVGLNVANAQHANKEFAVYLSGNGPLVKVLTEALARNAVKNDENLTLKEARVEVKSFIQSVHHYRDTTISKLVSPRNENNELQIDESKINHDKKHGYGEVEGVAIFDEAQRAWTRKDLADFLKDPTFPMSESGFFLWSMNLRNDFAVVVCLVGNGQEINHGEAGIKEWINALLKDEFSDWEIYLSKELIQNELENEEELLNRLRIREQEKHNVIYDEDFHLKTSQRSLRSEKISLLVDYILDHNPDAISLYNSISHKYPIVLTRSIDKAKEWLRKKSCAVGTENFLKGKCFSGTLKDWLLANCKKETIKSLLLNDFKKSPTRKWILENYPDGSNKSILLGAAGSGVGSCYDRVVSACTDDIYKEYFKYKCPEVNIRQWVDDTFSDSLEDKGHLLEELPIDFRYGLVASSGAKRLKALGIEVKNEKQVSVANWFLDPSEDIRSSNFMEEVVSEFVIQGLELDYVGLIWDADFRSMGDSWGQYKFTGSSWGRNNSEENRDYQLNAYRVLLSRARLGMVIVVPEGDRMHVDGTIDKTRLPEFYDETYKYLKGIGFEVL